MATSPQDWATTLSDKLNGLTLDRDSRAATIRKRCEALWDSVYVRMNALAEAARNPLGQHGMQLHVTRSDNVHLNPSVEIRVFSRANDRNTGAAFTISVKSDGEVTYGGLGKETARLNLDAPSDENTDEFFAAILLGCQRKKLGL